MRVIKMVLVALSLIVGLLSFSQKNEARFIEKQVFVTLTEERVNGQCFAHRTDVLNGTLKEIWAIDGKMVNQDEFMNAILEAEKEERRVEREQKDRAQRELLQAHILLQRSCYEKLISVFINDIVSLYHKVADGRLRPFWALKKNSFENVQQLELLMNEQLPTAQTLLKKNETSLEVLQNYVHQFELAHQKLTVMYHDTLFNAQKNADDPRLLKELLAMTTEL